ncbi:hypothetical protein, partial [Actinotignum sanguinis]|uniref:hypothetical protein n=1 Tax=Actinotignum sanguinis TaxID=1445614 RepID=UPI00254ADF10
FRLVDLFGLVVVPPTVPPFSAGAHRRAVRSRTIPTVAPFTPAPFPPSRRARRPVVPPYRRTAAV